MAKSYTSLEEVVAKFGTSVPVDIVRYKLDLKSGDYKNALKVAKRISKSPYYNDEIKRTHAVCHLKKGNYKEALSTIKKIDSLKTIDRFNLSLILTSLGHFDVAKKTLERLIGTDQTSDALQEGIALDTQLGRFNGSFHNLFIQKYSTLDQFDIRIVQLDV